MQRMIGEIQPRSNESLSRYPAARSSATTPMARSTRWPIHCSVSGDSGGRTAGTRGGDGRRRWRRDGGTGARGGRGRDGARDAAMTGRRGPVVAALRPARPASHQRFQHRDALLQPVQPVVHAHAAHRAASGFLAAAAGGDAQGTADLKRQHADQRHAGPGRDRTARRGRAAGRPPSPAAAPPPGPARRRSGPRPSWFPARAGRSSAT